MCDSFSWFQLLVKPLTFARGIVDFTNKFVFQSVLNVGQEKHPCQQEEHMFFQIFAFGATYLYMICESLRCINMLILCMGIILVSLVATQDLKWLIFAFGATYLYMVCESLGCINSYLFLFDLCLQVTDRSLASLQMRSWQFYLRRKMRSGSFFE